jgi:hypothetical protein
MVAVENRRGTIGGSRPTDPNNQSDRRQHEKLAQRPKPAHQTRGSSI